jgi:BolA protein
MRIQQSIEARLRAAFAPAHLEVVNESHMHSVPPGSETHFKLTLASGAFEGKRAVARHQLVYGVLAEELRSGVHALALHTWTPQEWAARGGASPASPPCLGGSKHDAAV